MRLARRRCSLRQGRGEHGLIRLIPDLKLPVASVFTTPLPVRQDLLCAQLGPLPDSNQVRKLSAVRIRNEGFGVPQMEEESRHARPACS
jgi:hypothetical protein